MRKVINTDGVELLCERIATYGESVVSDVELLTVMLGDASLALELLGRFTSLARLCEAPRIELERSRLCRPTHLARVKAAAEIGRRIVKGKSDAAPRYLRSSADTIAFFKSKLEELETEVLFLVLLDTRKKVMRVIELARGGVNQLSVYPREILAPAIRELAHSMILVHSHPSGDPSPSQADRELTRRVQAAGEMVGIPLLDHVIVAREGGVSIV